VPDSANTPGARQEAVSWTDASGKLWMFGGCDQFFTWYFNDLWQYDPDTGNWTWMKGGHSYDQNGTYGTMGVPNPANTPGARHFATSWVDSSGKLWLFGGYGRDGTGNEGQLNDLWQYDPGTGSWTWMKGSKTTNPLGTYGTQGIPSPANTPGARRGAIAWADNAGNLWLFGGRTNSNASFNDLWQYDPATGNWTWMKGASTTNQPGTYGRKGIPAPNNTPGARHDSVSWCDASGKLWLFSGQGYVFNDLWQYNPGTGNWAWMDGRNKSVYPQFLADYGTQGVPDPDNTPGAREQAIGWIDDCGKLWLFGGFGQDSEGWSSVLNDLWQYNLATGNWTWMKGSSIREQVGIYGTQGVQDPANTPGARKGAMAWTDGHGKLWLFGGVKYDASGFSGYFNDLWSGVQVYTVTFRTDGAKGATLTGGVTELAQMVNHGSDSSPVDAFAPPGRPFFGWTGDCIAGDNPLTATKVLANMTIMGHFGNPVAKGTTFSFFADDVNLPIDFTVKPRVYGTFGHPITGKVGRKVAVKQLTQVGANRPAGTIVCEWIGKIKLFKARDFAAAQRGGEAAEGWLSNVANQSPLAIVIHVCSTLAIPFDRSVFSVQLRPPTIADIADGPLDLKGNPTLVITGQWFGTKAPKVWREYLDPKTLAAIKRQAMKVVKPTLDNTDFLDSKGKPACMDPATGESKVIVIVPVAPKGALNGTVVLENGVGLAAGDAPGGG
jgi:N-acetylneuraminic acid mutarotase